MEIALERSMNTSMRFARSVAIADADGENIWQPVLRASALFDQRQIIIGESVITRQQLVTQIVGDALHLCALRRGK